MSQPILALREAGVLTLTFNRADKKNALTQEMYTLLHRELEQGAADDGVRVVVLQGGQDLFSSGNDVTEFLQRPPGGLDTPVFDFLRSLADFPKPVIAAVGGPAVGIGTTMLLHCDFVYCGDNALFSVPFVNLGLSPEAACSLLLPLRVGPAAAAEMLMFGEPMAADDALAIGLVTRVLPPEQLLEYAQSQARKLAAKPQASLVLTKQLLRKAQQEAVHAVMADEAWHFARMLQGPAAKEAFGAFLAKRKPDFSKL
ncbi:MAG: enoyl-CoA hydratase [Betaproteobacteria bacterium]|nr:enoyl-CoA hydratase [Betaproteobacteria bacterium]